MTVFSLLGGGVAVVLPVRNNILAIDMLLRGVVEVSLLGGVMEVVLLLGGVV